MILLRVISLISLLVIVSGQLTCQKLDFDRLNMCFNDSVSIFMKYYDRAGQQCFQDNDCQAAWDSIDNDPTTEKIDYPNANPNTKYQGVMQCFIQVAERVQSDIDTCVGKVYPGFTLLNIDNFKELITSPWSERMHYLLEAAGECGDSDAVQNCLSQNFGRDGRPSPAVQFCSSLHNCIQHLPCDIQRVKNQLCVCANDVLSFDHGSANSYINEFYACTNSNAPDVSRYRGLFGPFLADVAQKICTGDPCYGLQAVNRWQ